MNPKTGFINKLSMGVYQKMGEELLKSRLLNGSPFITHGELTQHISNDFSDYIYTEEQKQLIIDNLCYCAD